MLIGIKRRGYRNAILAKQIHFRTFRLSTTEAEYCPELAQGCSNYYCAARNYRIMCGLGYSSLKGVENTIDIKF